MSKKAFTFGTATYYYPTRPRRPFSKGDFVDVMTGEHNRLSTRRIVKVRKSSVVTDCGRRWTQRGWWRGDARDWPFPWIRHSRHRTVTAD
jgi:hypothetical protein